DHAPFRSPGGRSHSPAPVACVGTGTSRRMKLMDSQSYSPGTTYNILFVCTGNTCRSPMAEAVARDAVHRRGWQHVQVASAGTSAESGAPAAAQAVSVAARRGI